MLIIKCETVNWYLLAVSFQRSKAHTSESESDNDGRKKSKKKGTKRPSRSATQSKKVIESG